jgi:hypothetical protein
MRGCSWVRVVSRKAVFPEPEPGLETRLTTNTPAARNSSHRARAVRSPEVYRANLDAATLRFFHDSVHYAHRNREFARALAVPILYSIAEALAGGGVWRRVLKE